MTTRNSHSSIEIDEGILKLDQNPQHDASGETKDMEEEDEFSDYEGEEEEEDDDGYGSESYDDDEEEEEEEGEEGSQSPVKLPIVVDLFHLAQKPHHLHFGHQHQMLVLVSLYGQANHRESMTQQNHTLTILQGVLGNTMEEPFLLVDASDPTHQLQRDALLEISGCGPVYPQFFLVKRRAEEPTGRTIHELYEEIDFFGDYNDLFEANERGTLRSSFLSRKPLVRKLLEEDDDDDDEEQGIKEEEESHLADPFSQLQIPALHRGDDDNRKGTLEETPDATEETTAESKEESEQEEEIETVEPPIQPEAQPDHRKPHNVKETTVPPTGSTAPVDVPEPQPEPKEEETPARKPRNSIKKDKPKLKENALCPLPDWVETWMFLPSNPVVAMTTSTSRTTYPNKTVEIDTEATLILRNGERHTQSHKELIEP
jgi:hypothetical protein